MKKPLNPDWKIVSSSYIHQDEWFTARKDAVVLPNGTTIPQFFVLEYPAWVCVVGITKSGKFLLISQYRHGIGKAIYEIPAGVVDEEENSFLDAAKREMFEETGYGGGVWEELLVCSANPSTHNNLCYCFLARDIEKLGDQNLDATEMIDVHLFSKAEVSELLNRNEILQAIHAAALWKCIAMRLYNK